MNTGNHNRPWRSGTLPIQPINYSNGTPVYRVYAGVAVGITFVVVAPNLVKAKLMLEQAASDAGHLQVIPFTAIVEIDTSETAVHLLTS